MLDRIPTFYLYGEPHRTVEPGFIHVEPLDDRSRPSEWTIRAHAHVELSHIFLISQGGGAVNADDQSLLFEAPAILIVPAGIVHGFAWTRESSGWVVTLAKSELDMITHGDHEIADLFASTRMIGMSTEDCTSAAMQMMRLERELAWTRPGRHAALRSGLLDLIVLSLRASALTMSEQPRPSRRATLVARYRERVEARFRLRENVGAHARALHVSPSTLRAACLAVSGLPPAALLDQRAILEARRALLFSSLGIAEIGWSVGFADPAYFSRFFTRHVGQAPSSYRSARSRPPAREFEKTPDHAT